MKPKHYLSWIILGHYFLGAYAILAGFVWKQVGTTFLNFIALLTPLIIFPKIYIHYLNYYEEVTKK